jgi:surfeit locus 1 family protein
LGIWQGNRAEVRRKVQAEAAAHAALAPLTIAATTWMDAPLPQPGRRLVAHGKYLAAPQILLDNQVLRGHAGYAVFTPFLLADGSGGILVERGFVAQGPSRAAVPALALPTGVTEIAGTLRPFVHPAWGDPGQTVEAMGAEILRVQRVVPATLAPLLRSSAATAKGCAAAAPAGTAAPAAKGRCALPLAPFALMLAVNTPGALLQDPPNTANAFGPERNLAYRLQWWGLALVVAGFYIVAIRRHSRGRSGPPPARG